MVTVLVKRLKVLCFFKNSCCILKQTPLKLVLLVKILLFALKGNKELMNNFTCVLKNLNTRMSFLNGKSKQKERNKNETPGKPIHPSHVRFLLSKQFMGARA